VKELQPDAAVLAQPMAIAVHALRRSRLRSGETAAVIGVGGIGAFIVAAAARLGATVLAFDTNPGRAVIAKRLGAHDAIVPEPSTTPGHVTPPNVVFEASGTAGGWDLAIAMAGASSRLVIVGLQNERREVDLRAASQRELELIGTNAHRGTGDLDEALMVLASREIGWSDVAPRAVPLSEIVERGILPLLEHRATVIKTLVDPWANASRATATSSG
jgi:(R,R)-butanediol dehydrogenase/meso-butanediol dehydrogenase/diacetyl reductase